MQPQRRATRAICRLIRGKPGCCGVAAFGRHQVGVTSEGDGRTCRVTDRSAAVQRNSVDNVVDGRDCFWTEWWVKSPTLRVLEECFGFGCRPKVSPRPESSGTAAPGERLTSPAVWRFGDGVLPAPFVGRAWCHKALRFAVAAPAPGQALARRFIVGMERWEDG